MSFFSSITRQLAPAVATVAPFFGPVGQGVAVGASIVAGDTANKQRKANNLIQQQRNQQMPNFNDMSAFGHGGGIGGQRVFNAPTNNGRFSGFSSFLGDIGQNIVDPISNLFSGVAPFFSQQSQGQPALATKSLSGGQESQSSGTNDAFLGGAGNLLSQAAKLLRSPGGAIGTGVGGSIVGNMFSGGQTNMRITRKMKSQYRAVLNLNMGNYQAASDMLGVSQDMFIQVLLKRFRNDGPVVTKAALRKTKTTVRRLKSMCDMYDSLRPTATRRKAPMRRASSTTLIRN
jgi:hypothetical protein